jgi:hypothetical protein
MIDKLKRIQKDNLLYQRSPEYSTILLRTVIPGQCPGLIKWHKQSFGEPSRSFPGFTSLIRSDIRPGDLSIYNVLYVRQVRSKSCLN